MIQKLKQGIPKDKEHIAKQERNYFWTWKTLLENRIVESNEGKVAEMFNKHFVNISETLDMATIHEYEPLKDHMTIPA